MISEEQQELELQKGCFDICINKLKEEKNQLIAKIIKWEGLQASMETQKQY